MQIRGKFITSEIIIRIDCVKIEMWDYNDQNVKVKNKWKIE